MNKPCFIAVTNRNLCKRPFFDVIEDLSKKDVKTIVLREIYVTTKGSVRRCETIVL